MNFSLESDACRTTRSDYLNTFEFLDKLAENLSKKQSKL